VSAKPASSSALLMAPTRPSIMSEGATKSAPATACDSAILTRLFTVGSLRIVSPSSRPQWPCEVYSHRQTSVKTSAPGTSRLMARMADWTGASESHADDPLSSFDAGRPNRMTLRTPSALAAAVSFTASSTERLKTPGIDATSRRTPRPSQTNSGSTSASADRRVSRTRLRIASVRRRRRGRCVSARRVVGGACGTTGSGVILPPAVGYPFGCRARRPPRGFFLKVRCSCGGREHRIAASTSKPAR